MSNKKWTDQNWILKVEFKVRTVEQNNGSGSDPSQIIKEIEYHGIPSDLKPEQVRPDGTIESFPESITSLEQKSGYCDKFVVSAMIGPRRKCPGCDKVYMPDLPKEKCRHGSIQMEQWMTGICSDDCWIDFLGC